MNFWEPEDFAAKIESNYEDEPEHELGLDCWPWNYYELSWPIVEEIDAIISKAN